MSLKDPDFTYHFYEIALISGLELWLGVIVNCMPTLGPLANVYIKPAISKLKSLTSSGGGSHTDRQVHLDLLPTAASRRKYYNIDSTNHVNNDFAIQTECTHDPNAGPADERAGLGVIHVRKDIESQGETAGN